MDLEKKYPGEKDVYYTNGNEYSVNFEKKPKGAMAILLMIILILTNI